MPRVDVVVAGGGTSGSVLAARLSEDPSRSVLLLEGGPDDSSYDQSITSPSRAHLVWRGSPFATVFPMRRPDGEPSVMIGGSVLGGTSAVNYMATIRGQPADYDAWAARGLPSWSWADVRQTFVDLETDLDFPDSEIHGASGPLRVRRWRRGEFAPFHAAFYDGLVDLQIPVSGDLNDPAQLPGIGVFPATVDPATLERLTVSRAYLTADVRSRPNLEIRCGTQVASICFDGIRATGVRTAAGEVIDASEVIVAAGAFGSPALLQRSGIGPADVLADAGVDVRVALPGVGQNYQDHVGTLIKYQHDGPAPMIGSPGQPVWVDASDAGVDIHVFPVPVAPLDTEPTVFALITFLLKLSGRGHVAITSPDPAALPAVELPGASDQDLKRLVPVFATIARWEQTPAYSRLGATRLAPTGQLGSLDTVRDAWRTIQQSYGHQVGTCAMGPDSDPMAVLDERCAVRGTQQLRVADASAMPTIPAGNTYLGCVMIAERVAALLR